LLRSSAERKHTGESAGEQKVAQPGHRHVLHFFESLIMALAYRPVVTPLANHIVVPVVNVL
jgi:hypothetical protein